MEGRTCNCRNLVFLILFVIYFGRDKLRRNIILLLVFCICRLSLLLFKESLLFWLVDTFQTFMVDEFVCLKWIDFFANFSHVFGCLQLVVVLIFRHLHSIWLQFNAENVLF
jgi:hypothetical protein